MQRDVNRKTTDNRCTCVVEERFISCCSSRIWDFRAAAFEESVSGEVGRPVCGEVECAAIWDEANYCVGTYFSPCPGTVCGCGGEMRLEGGVPVLG